MTDRLVTVATFSVDVEAELAKNRLSEEGIRAFLLGETATGLWQLGSSFGAIQLQVADQDAERALDLLATLPLKREVHVEGWDQSEEEDEEPEPEPETSITARPEPVGNLDASVTAHPGTVRTELPDAEESEEEAALSAVDAIATRAWRAAIFGLLVCPLVFHVYSVGMLIWLACVPGELSDRGRRRLYEAVLIDIVVFAALGLFLFSQGR